MVAIDSITTFVIASILLGLSPGPDNIFVITQSALYGRKAGMLITIGLCTGLIAHTSAVAFGIAVIIQSSEMAFNALKIIGATYLLYLAWQAFRASSVNVNIKNLRLTNSQLYRRGVIMNITNPKVSIFFLAFLPQFTEPTNGPIAQQVFILGAVFILVTLFVFGSIALLAGTLGHWLTQSKTAQLNLHRIAGIVLASLAIKLMTENIYLEQLVMISL